MLLSKGADALRESELIAILLRTGTQGLSAIDVAQSLQRLRRGVQRPRRRRVQRPAARADSRCGSDRAV